MWAYNHTHTKILLYNLIFYFDMVIVKAYDSSMMRIDIFLLIFKFNLFIDYFVLNILYYND